MKKDSEYSGNFDKKSTPVIKIGVPTEFDLHRAQYHESGKTKQSKVESKSVPPPHVSHMSLICLSWRRFFQLVRLLFADVCMVRL